MKIIKIILITLLLLLAAALLLWCMLNYLVWRKPEIIGLAPGVPLAYVTASNLDEVLADVKESEFASRLVRSPIWETLKSSELWKMAEKQRKKLEKQIMASIDPKGVIKLVSKDALFALHHENGRLDFLLVSEVDVLTRIHLKSWNTERALAKVYELTKEKYRGIELITLAVPGLKFSYGFIGKAGMLSTNISLLKKSVDLHRGDDQGLVADLPESEVSFYVNSAKIRAAAAHPLIFPLITMAKADPHLRYLTPISERVDAWAGAVFRQSGGLTFDIRADYKSPGGEIASSLGLDDLPVPADCLLFARHETLGVDTIFETLAAVIGSELNMVGNKLSPVLHSGAAVVVLKPNIEGFQLLPPVMLFFRMKDKAKAQSALKDLNGAIEIRERRLTFTETEYADTVINHTRAPIGMGMSLDAGYAMLGDDLLVIASDTSALELAVDVSLNKQQSLMKNRRYGGVLSPIIEASQGQIFVDIGSASAMTKQAGKLYAWRAKLAGEREAERIATMLYQNVFILDAWRYMGMTFESDSDRASVRMILNAGN